MLYSCMVIIIIFFTFIDFLTLFLIRFFYLFFFSFFFFFFSSRRRHTSCALVTGVQTCALPICPLSRFVPHIAGAVIGVTLVAAILPLPKLLLWNASASAPIGLYRINPFARPAVDDMVAVAPPPALARRSAERRVGKECVSTCRSRWSPDN